MPTPITGKGPWLRQKDAAAYLGLSPRQFATWQQRGWVKPDKHLPSPTGGRALPVYLATSLDAALARLNDPKSRVLAAEKISAAKRRKAS